MAEPPDGIDLEALLAPISPDTPTGTDLREDVSPTSLYYKLRDAHASARTAERAAITPDPLNPPDPPQWRPVRDLAAKALQEKTKDLQIATWLTEALVRLDGLAGLAAGAKVIAGLVERFWDSNLYPVPDEYGVETRVGPLTGLNGSSGEGSLLQPLRLVTIFNRPDGTSLRYWDYLQSTERRPGSVPFQDLENEGNRADKGALAARHVAAIGALGAWQAMTEVLDAKAGVDAPPTRDVRDLLDAIRRAIALFAPAAPVPASDSAQETLAEAGAAAEGGAPSATPVNRPAESRDDMLRELSRIAAWFRRTEPHSPLAYTLDEAVRRGRMGWPELLAELVGDASTRHGILNSLGIRPPPDETA